MDLGGQLVDSSGLVGGGGQLVPSGGGQHVLGEHGLDSRPLHSSASTHPLLEHWRALQIMESVGAEIPVHT